MSDSNNTKRIAQNTMLLYIRMFILMFISFFTSRVILQVLGIDDYGIYNVVSGFVAMFSILSGSLANAISRFIQFELGRNDLDKLKRTFSTGVNMQIGMALLVFILAEIIGFWFLNYKMNIESSRISAATWVLHCSIIASMVNLVSVPYNAVIIAHEKMSAFAYISLIEAILKLAITYSLFVSPFDKLVTYSVFLLIVSVLIRWVYGRYCNKNFEESKYVLSWDKDLMKEMSSFVGWNFLGNGMVYVNNQGITLLINVYFGVAINAARGIALQVNNAIQQFITNFVLAVQPQITKSYAAGDIRYSFKLTCFSSKLAFTLTYFFALPILVETEEILRIWLVNPPDYSATFIRWSVATSLFSVVANIMYYLQMAHGDIKKYQIWTTIVNFLIFPLSWICFEFGYSVVLSYEIAFIASFILIFVRFYVVNEKTGFPFKEYIVDVVFRCFLVAIVASVIPVLIRFQMQSGYVRLIVNLFVCVIINLILFYGMILTSEERQIMLKHIKKIWNTKHFF